MKKALIADDLEKNRYLLHQVLASDGWHVTEAVDGQEALDLALAAPPRLIISDVLMPTMDGFVLCEKWKRHEKLKDIPFIFYTATFNDPHDSALADALGADAFLCSPMEPDALLETVRRIDADIEAGRPARRPNPAAESTELVNDYTRSLVRKLEEKLLELESSNACFEETVNELREAERLRSLSEDQLEKFFRVVPDLFCIADMKGYFRHLSPSWKKVLGWSLAELEGKPFVEFIHPDDVEATKAAMTHLAAGKPLNSFINRYRSRDAQWHALEWVSGPPTAAGEIYAAARDVTARLETEARLRLLDIAIQATAHGVVIVDASGNIEWANPAFTRMTGYELDEVKGQNPRILKSGKHDHAFYEKLWSTISSGRQWEGNIINRRKDGTLYEEEANITPVLDPAGSITHYIAIKQDVTEQHQLERRLLRSQRMESIGLLAGGVAHDLNNVLAPIMMAVDMLRTELSPEDRDEIISTLAVNCERGAGIIRQVLTFARGVEGQRVLVQLRHLVKDMVKIAKETFPRNLTIEMNVPSNLWTVMGDATQLHQVLLNLFVNARDALPSGGRILVQAANEDLGEPRRFLDMEIPSGRHVHLQVVDNGAGMSAAVLDRIFEPFFTTKEQGHGTGLGLPTILGIVKSHHGLIEVESKPGGGATFHVYLPAAETADEEAAKQDRTIPRGRGQKVLVVDDEPGVLTVTTKLLQRSGYEVITAVDGAEAIAKYALEPRSIDIVLTDIMMPIMDGVALVKALRAVDPEVRVIGSSGFVGDQGGLDRTEELRRLGVNTILGKPYTAEDLLVSLHEELES